MFPHIGINLWSIVIGASVDAVEVIVSTYAGLFSFINTTDSQYIPFL